MKRAIAILAMLAGAAFGQWDASPVLAVLNAPVNADVSPGPIAKWLYNEGAGTTAADATGNGNTGTLVSNVAWTASGKAGAALTFGNTAATRGWVTNINVGLNIGAQTNWTVSFWMRNQSLVANSGVHVFNNYGVVCAAANKLSLFINDNAIRSFDPPPSNNWFQVIVTCVGVTYAAYTNGASAPLSVTSNSGWGIGGLYATGRGYNWPTYPLKADLDLVEQYNYGFTAAQALQHYNAEK